MSCGYEIEMTGMIALVAVGMIAVRMIAMIVIAMVRVHEERTLFCLKGQPITSGKEMALAVGVI
jgi:hypothetical protein